MRKAQPTPALAEMYERDQAAGVDPLAFENAPPPPAQPQPPSFCIEARCQSPHTRHACSTFAAPRKSMARDRRYSTSAWQKTRRAILMRDGYTCQLRGPRCQHRATSVRHILPSSQYPHLFYDSTNLQASCGPCNYSGGREIQLANRSDRQMLNHYEQTIEQMQEEIDELTRRLEEHERPKPRPMPAIR